ncbi:hypothetical protein C8Q79DRAFT_902087 [Trametes meyenii]|nr:hypothetical protein C8Q79DRAFT_902087 [Trametes meyenii]
MEHTLFMSFCMANNLRSIFATPPTSEALRDFTPLLERSFGGESARYMPSLADFGLTADDSVAANAARSTALPTILYQGLLRRLASDPSLSESTSYRPFNSRTNTQHTILNPNGQILGSVNHRGRRYADVAHNHGDSQVIYFRAGTKSTDASYGQIQTIFLHERCFTHGGFHRQVFAAVKAYPPPTPAQARLDPYRTHRGLGAQLISAQLDPVVEIIPMHDIFSHFVSCPYSSLEPPPADEITGPFQDAPCLVVVALDEGWNY